MQLVQIHLILEETSNQLTEDDLWAELVSFHSSPVLTAFLPKAPA